jgi:SAM-dependent methyltransferase
MVTLIFTTPSRYAYDRRIAGIVRSILPRRGGGMVLDIGCGDGRYAHFFDEHYYVGIDIGDYDYSSVATPNRQFCRARSEAPPFTGGQFDLLFSSFMIEHVPDINITLEQFKQQLSPGGALFLSTGTQYASLTGEMHRLFWPESGESVGQAHHYFRKGRLSAILAEGGWCDIKERYIGGPLGLVIGMITMFLRLLSMKIRGERYLHGRDSNETGREKRRAGGPGRLIWRLMVPPLFLIQLLINEGTYWIDLILSPLRCSKFVVITARKPVESSDMDNRS